MTRQPASTLEQVMIMHQQSSGKTQSTTTDERRETMRHADEVIETFVRKCLPDTEDPVLLYRAAFRLALSRKPETLGLVAFYNGHSEDLLPRVVNLDFSKLSGRENLWHTFARVLVAEALELEEPITVDFHEVRPPRQTQKPLLRAA